MSQATVNTVLGPVPVSELGPTLMHEHLLIGYPGWEAHTTEPGLSRAEMIDVCVAKIESLQALGVNSLVDPCPNDLGRDVELAAEVSRKTGFNIICATGLYKEDEGGRPHWHFMLQLGVAEDRMVELMTHELTHGIGSTGIKPGVIKVATGKDQITDYEMTILRAAARVSVATGTPITTHTDSGTLGDQQQAILTEGGVAPHKIIIGHSCGTDNHDYHMKIAEGGSYLGFDRFGLDFFVSDDQRIDSLVKMLKRGKEKQIVVSHDCVWCTRGTPFPPEMMPLVSKDPDRAFDPTHFHRNIVPRLLEAGITQDQIDTLLIDNPRRYFSGEQPG